MAKANRSGGLTGSLQPSGSVDAASGELAVPRAPWQEPARRTGGNSFADVGKGVVPAKELRRHIMRQLPEPSSERDDQIQSAESVDGVKPHKVLVKRSRRKRDIHRPYLPDYVTREEIAYRVQVSIATVDSWISHRLLPEPLTVVTVKRWRWVDVEDLIAVQNLLANGNAPDPTSPEDDPFLEGVKRVEAADG